MEKRLNAIQLAAILRIWSITADKDIPLIDLVNSFTKLHTTQMDAWLKLTIPIVDCLVNQPLPRYEVAIASVIHRQFTNAEATIQEAETKFLSMHPQDQKVWLDEARKRISECYDFQ
mgnify:CR=1 FL=1